MLLACRSNFALQTLDDILHLFSVPGHEKVVSDVDEQQKVAQSDVIAIQVLQLSYSFATRLILSMPVEPEMRRETQQKLRVFITSFQCFTFPTINKAKRIGDNG